MLTILNVTLAIRMQFAPQRIHLARNEILLLHRNLHEKLKAILCRWLYAYWWVVISSDRYPFGLLF